MAKGVVAPPVPFPNTVVKHHSTYNTAPSREWDDRPLPERFSLSRPRSASSRHTLSLARVVALYLNERVENPLRHTVFLVYLGTRQPRDSTNLLGLRRMRAPCTAPTLLPTARGPKGEE